eukprot:c17820_g1_i1 orf=162-998(+)
MGSMSPPSLLEGKDDRYSGFIIDPVKLPKDSSTFLRNLKYSLSKWKSQSKKGIWLNLPKELSEFVPLAIKNGFDYHHAEKEYVMLTHWIPESPSTLPANASHQVGVGAIVINDQNEILVVQEVTGPTQGSGVWKMPTGVVHQGEDIRDGVVREIKEETGVDAKFVEVLGVRQAHDVAFGKSDLFFACLLQPLSSDILVQESEIAKAQWMDLDAFRKQDFNTNSDLLTRIADIATASIEDKYHGFDAEILTFGFRKKGAYFYHNMKDINKYLKSKSSSL